MSATPESGPRRDQDLRWGLIYTHNRANWNTGEIEKVAATLEALVNLLIERDLVSLEQLEELRAEASKRIRSGYKERGMAVIRQDFDVSKYDFGGGVEIDCESRVHLCKAACCRLTIGLSIEDVAEGVLDWDLGQPYALAKGDDGWCVHMERGSCACTVYAQRPIPCRGFDCRNDRRIWLDFEGRVPNPAVDHPDWPSVVEDESRPAGA